MNKVTNGRLEIVDAAEQLYCNICRTTPCFLLSTAAMAVLQQSIVTNDGLVAGLRYEELLERLHTCIIRHHEAAMENFGLSASETATCYAKSLLRDIYAIDRDMFPGNWPELPEQGEREDEEDIELIAQ